MSDAAACTWPLRVSPQAAKDFGDLIESYREKVVRCLANPGQPGKWKKLKCDRGNLWGVRVVRDVRLVVNVQRGIAYVWKIALRRDVYGEIDNQDPRLALTGITIEEFLMKAGARLPAKSNDEATKAATNGCGNGGGLVSPPAAGPAPADDGDRARPPSHPLLTALSRYLSDQLRSDVDAILALVEDRVVGFQGELRGQVEITAGLAKAHDALAGDLDRIGGRVTTLDEALSAATNRINGELGATCARNEGEIAALSSLLDRRVGDLHAACDEDRKNVHLGFTELGRQVAILAVGEDELRSSVAGHDTVLRRVDSEVRENSAVVSQLLGSVAELTHEMDRLRQERSSRRKPSPFSTLATRIRAAFSPRGFA